MKAACAKCAAMDNPVTPPAPIQNHTPVQGEHHQETTKHDGVNTEDENSVHPKPVFDPTKLHQAILAYRPVKSSFSNVDGSVELFFECFRIHSNQLSNVH